MDIIEKWKKDTGFLVGIKSLLTPEQWTKVQELLKDGKKAEAQKMIDDIIAKEQVV
jgi:hypothetical protein